MTVPLASRSHHESSASLAIAPAHLGRMSAPLKESVARVLASAFGTGIWSKHPMRMGSDADPQSARGIIAGLGAEGRALLAWCDDPSDGRVRRTVGCVLGATLDSRLLDAYGLGPFGARPGDGLLAYIGVVPEYRGARASVAAPGNDGSPSVGSLAGALFGRWLALPTIQRCPRVFVRTRHAIPAVQHLARKNAFELCGELEICVDGERQDRLIFRRDNVAPMAAENHRRGAAA